jgi:hypothetical protein
MIRHANRFSRAQRGAALIAAIALFSLILVGVLFATARGDSVADRDAITARAFAAARDALIARAAMDANRPGGLPCPDLLTDNPAFNNVPNDGIADAGGGCPSYVGRLPWKTLDLPDLRDGHGERLWYALSPNFRAHTSGGVINSDTAGALNVVGAYPAANVIAIVFSAGPALQTQLRDAAGSNTPSNFLEGQNADFPANQQYENGASTPTFNDVALVITRNMFMPAVEQRVARQALRCLVAFSALPGANGRFPWAAPVASDPPYPDEADALFGRLPTTLTATKDALGPAAASLDWPEDSPDPGSAERCFAAGWWNSWRDLLFYAVADSYKPGPTPAPASCPSASSCLYVNNRDSVKVVVMVAGRRTVPNTAAGIQMVRPTYNVFDYLETDPSGTINNANGSGHYARARAFYSDTVNFNDTLACLSNSATNPCP